MAICKSTQLVAECRAMAGADGKREKTAGKIEYFADRWGYVYGAQGQLYTRELAAEWGRIKRSGKSAAYFTRDCARWYGRRVVDCSGMIVQAMRAYKPSYGDRSSTTFYNRDTSERGPIKTLPEEPGLIVWKQGHIGIYIGGGKVIEARGYKYGVVISELSTQRWTNWGRLKDVEYIDEPAKPVFARELRYRRKMMRGEDVRELQHLLVSAAGQRLTDDGIFGKKTRDAVRAAQRKFGLKVDGIAGKNTITALGGIWRG